MGKNLHPDFYCDNIYEINFETLFERGIRGLIFDIDNTLVKDGVRVPDQENLELFEKLKSMGYKMALLSNNSKNRVDAYSEGLMFFSKHRSNKPSRRGYRQAIESLGLKNSQVAMVGDQIYTDVWGANRAGLMSILVRPHNPKETLFCAIKRIFEKGIISKAKSQEEYFYG